MSIAIVSDSACDLPKDILKKLNITEVPVNVTFGDKVYNTIIPRNVRISEAPSHGLPVLLYDTKCYGSKAYAALSAEVILQEEI